MRVAIINNHGSLKGVADLDTERRYQSGNTKRGRMRLSLPKIKQNLKELAIFSLGGEVGRTTRYTLLVDLLLLKASSA